jgi:hypothetical protein
MLITTLRGPRRLTADVFALTSPAGDFFQVDVNEVSDARGVEVFPVPFHFFLDEAQNRFHVAHRTLQLCDERANDKQNERTARKQKPSATDVSTKQKHACFGIR